MSHSESPFDPDDRRDRDPDAARDGGDPREWGAAAHVAVWSKPTPNRVATVAAAYCAASLLPWLLLMGFGRRGAVPPALVGCLLPLPLIGALVSAVAYRKAAPPRLRRPRRGVGDAVRPRDSPGVPGPVAGVVGRVGAGQPADVREPPPP